MRYPVGQQTRASFRTLFLIFFEPPQPYPSSSSFAFPPTHTHGSRRAPLVITHIHTRAREDVDTENWRFFAPPPPPHDATTGQEGVEWPEGLKRLVFGANFKQKVEAADWPDTLEELTFGSYFNLPIEGVKW